MPSTGQFLAFCAKPPSAPMILQILLLTSAPCWSHSCRSTGAILQRRPHIHPSTAQDASMRCFLHTCAFFTCKIHGRDTLAAAGREWAACSAHLTQTNAATSEPKRAKRSGWRHTNAWEQLDMITEDAETVPVGPQGQHRPRNSIDSIDVAPQVVLVDACAHRDT